MQLPHFIAVILFLVLLAHFGYYYPILPEMLASHFGLRGKPDGWMSKDGFIVFEVVLLLIIAFLKFGVPHLFKKIPAALVNIPNRHYWLAEERKQHTLEILHREMGWVFVGIVSLMIAVNHLIFQANLSDNKSLPNMFWLVFIGFLVFILIWFFRFKIIFKIPDEN